MSGEKKHSGLSVQTLLIAGAVANLAQGLTRAASALDSGAAAATLERLASLSNITTEAA